MTVSMIYFFFSIIRFRRIVGHSTKIPRYFSSLISGNLIGSLRGFSFFFFFFFGGGGGGRGGGGHISEAFTN